MEAYSLFSPHPNIIPALDHSVVSERHDPSAKTVYILLPYFRRGNLQDAINANLVNGGKFPERRLLVLFRGVCEALRAMHEYKKGGAPGGKRAQRKARGVREQGARADREAAAQDGGRRKRDAQQREGTDGTEDGDIEAEPLMEGEVSMAQDRVAEGAVRAYAHRDIKPGKPSLTQPNLCSST